MKHFIAGVVGLTMCLFPGEALAHNKHNNHHGHHRFHNHCHYHPERGYRHCHRHRRGVQHHPRRSHHGPFVYYPWGRPYHPHSTLEFNIDF